MKWIVFFYTVTFLMLLNMDFQYVQRSTERVFNKNYRNTKEGTIAKFNTLMLIIYSIPSL